MPYVHPSQISAELRRKSNTLGNFGEEAADCIDQQQDTIANLHKTLKRVKFALDGSIGKDFAALIPDTIKDLDAALVIAAEALH